MLVEKYLHGSFSLSLLHIPTAFSAAAACATSFSIASGRLRRMRIHARGNPEYVPSTYLGPSPMQTIIYQHCKSQMTFVSEFTSSQGLALNVDKCEASISSHWPKDLPYTHNITGCVYTAHARTSASLPPRLYLACFTPVAPVASLHSTHRLPFT